MSTLRWCPSCGAEVQAAWDACKFCRHDLVVTPPLSYDRSALTRASGRRRRGGPASARRRQARSAMTNVGIGVLALVVFGVAVGASGVLDHEPPSDAAPELLATGWVPVSPGGGFRVELPAAPVETVRERLVGNVTLPVTWFTADRDEHSYAIGVVDYPTELSVDDPAAILAGVPGGAAAEMGGSVRSTSPGALVGHAAIDYEVVSPAGDLVEATALLVGNRIYLITAAGPVEHRPDFDRLRTSFTLVQGP